MDTRFALCMLRFLPNAAMFSDDVNKLKGYQEKLEAEMQQYQELNTALEAELVVRFVP